MPDVFHQGHCLLEHCLLEGYEVVYIERHARCISQSVILGTLGIVPLHISLFDDLP